jgi:hypothetical protein
LIVLSLIGLAVIAYFIFYYKRKYNTGALLNTNNSTADPKYASNKSAEAIKK